jgi:hypothetical protein
MTGMIVGCIGVVFSFLIVNSSIHGMEAYVQPIAHERSEGLHGLSIDKIQSI